MPLVAFSDQDRLILHVYSSNELGNVQACVRELAGGEKNKPKRAPPTDVGLMTLSHHHSFILFQHQESES